MTTTAIKERPILFSAPMVRAILDGRKTQTRRIVKDHPGIAFEIGSYHKALTDRHGEQYPACTESFGIYSNDGSWSIECPYGQPGDRLWVRETCCSDGWSVHYAADNDHREFGDTRYDDVIKLHHYSGGFSKQVPSIHMPRWASRIDLEITGIRCERLNCISESDAVCEGIDTDGVICGTKIPAYKTYGRMGELGQVTRYPIWSFETLWGSIHAADGPHGWNANPFVWVVEFQKVE